MSGLHTFTVSGTGVFPHALMAAEGCRPVSQAALSAVSATGYRRVELEGPLPPHAQRWADAGWIVRNFDIELPPTPGSGDDEADELPKDKS